MAQARSVVAAFGERLAALAWVTDLWIAGSLATGDYVPGVSDLDLVALVDGPMDEARVRAVRAVHDEFDRAVVAHAHLGCVYVDVHTVPDPGIQHPTWTHGSLIDRTLSGITRAELVRHGYAQFGRSPAAVLPAMGDDDVREAARAEVCTRTDVADRSAASPSTRRDRALTPRAHGLDRMARRAPHRETRAGIAITMRG